MATTGQILEHGDTVKMLALHGSNQLSLLLREQWTQSWQDVNYFGRCQEMIMHISTEKSVECLFLYIVC